MRFEIDQPARARDRRVIRRRFVQVQAEKAAERQRIRRPPRDAALGVHAFEVADEQQAEIQTRQQAGPPQLRVKLRALRFHEDVEVVRVEHLVQPLIERMATRPWQLVHGDPQVRCMCAISTSSRHRHSCRQSMQSERFWRMIDFSSPCTTDS